MTDQTLEEIKAPAKAKKSEYHKMRDLCDEIVLEVFKNTVGVVYAQLLDNRLINVVSDDMKRFVACEYEDKYGIQPKDTTIKQIIMHLIGRARFTPINETYIRVGTDGQNWYYDLADGRSVRIEPGIWEIVQTPPIFPTDVRTQAQVHPVRIKNPVDDLYDLIKILNLTDDGQKLLFIFMLITCFIPDIKHPLVMVEGPMGSAKSTFAEIMQSIISPSGFGHIGHDKVMDIALQFSNRYFRSLDNVSEIGNNFSDMLCKAATGGEYTKRTAYTNTDETSMVLHKGITMINGIGISGRADMSERSVILNLHDLSDKKKLSRNHLDKIVSDLKPRVLGAIFTVLADIRSIEDERVVSDQYRMSDFTSWCRLISKVLWGNYEKFDVAMEINMRNIDVAIDESSSFAEYVIDQMYVINSCTGSMSYIYNTLMKSFFDDQRMSYKMPEGFPTHSNKLKSCLTRIERDLKKKNIFFDNVKYRQYRIWMESNDDELT